MPFRLTVAFLGHCGKVETAFHETAGKFAGEADSPHMALLNCDNQPVLCNAVSNIFFLFRQLSKQTLSSLGQYGVWKLLKSS
jgi:hypothetical protein